jgi:NTP pyrophosphatase (non-canonical NTP hydrolase)
VPDTLSDLTDLVRRFVEERDWARYHSPRNLAAALQVEAAELQQIYLWREDGDQAEERRADIEAEAADVGICLLNFCQVMGIDLAAAIRAKLLAAARKYPADRVRGRREKYDEYPEYGGEGP